MLTHPVKVNKDVCLCLENKCLITILYSFKNIRKRYYMENMKKERNM